MVTKAGLPDLPFQRLATPRRLLGLAILVPVSLLTYILLFSGAFQETTRRYPWTATWQDQQQQQHTALDCTPAQYANGSWVPRARTNATAMTAPDDALRFAGFQGCASSREFLWHLAADREEQYSRFPGAQSWAWVPGEGCEGLQPLDPERLVRDLVEDGGWYLVGDSVTENHFFSLSCILYPHVYATPDYTDGGSFNRAWPQNMYLSPSSPLLETISFPDGFNISSTPLITFRRNDLLLSKDRLVKVHEGLQPKPLENNTLFSAEAVWTIPLAEYLAEFLAPLPGAHYGTMVLSTGGHWTTTLFAHTSPGGMDGILPLFGAAMEFWAGGVQDVLSEYNGVRTHRKKRAVVRAYLPGHEDCHSFAQPWAEVQPFVWNWYNWGEIWKFNGIFERLLADKTRYPDIHYLAIDRPARLRPDAHTTGDCLHIMTGAGVLEGWSHYISHFIRNH